MGWKIITTLWLVAIGVPLTLLVLLGVIVDPSENPMENIGVVVTVAFLFFFPAAMLVLSDHLQKRADRKAEGEHRTQGREKPQRPSKSACPSCGSNAAVKFNEHKWAWCCPHCGLPR